MRSKKSPGLMVRLRRTLGTARIRLASALAPARALGAPPSFAEALALAPLPMIDLERRLILLFSPKSACTSAVIWFYQQSGLLDTAQRHHHWPHRYRTEVYNAGDIFARAGTFPAEHFTIVRVIRDPYSRCVSSFRHALATGYANDELREKLGLPLADGGPALSLSFERWIEFLERSDLRHCNPHHRVQWHPLESVRAPDYLIDVTRQKLYSELNRIEHEKNWPVTDFDNLEWLQRMHGRRDFHHRVEIADAPAQVLTREQARNGPWPTNEALLRPDLKQRIGRAYEVDVKAYGY